MSNSNRENFLQSLAKKYGRPLQTTPEPMPTWVNNYPVSRLSEKSHEELLANFIDFSGKLGIKVYQCNQDQTAQTVESICQNHNAQKIILNNDQRLVDLNITPNLQSKFSDVRVWKSDLGDENTAFAAQADVGICFGEYALSETGSIILEQNSNNGRSVSLLPTYNIVVIKASSLLPRMHQYAKLVDQRVKAGERTPSVINIISGPSSTADIELVRVVGVHGPVGLDYVIINDL